MAYADRTLRDANPVKRYLQNARFEDAIALLAGRPAPGRVLDFGGGDGELCLRLRDRLPGSELLCYEPAPGMYREADARLAAEPAIGLIDNLDGVAAGSVDAAFALEVFEHLPPAETDAALASLAQLLTPDGLLVVGVPNEIHLAALYKGLFRMTRRYGSFDAIPRNVLRACLGRPPTERPSRPVAPGKSYHFEHMGFDHRRFSLRLQRDFECHARRNSPFRLLPLWATPEIYYLLRKLPGR